MACTSYLLSLYFGYKTIKIIKAREHLFSSRTKAMQTQLTKALLIQVKSIYYNFLILIIAKSKTFVPYRILHLDISTNFNFCWPSFNSLFWSIL